MVRDLTLLATAHGHDVTILTFKQQSNHINDELLNNKIKIIPFPSSNIFSIKNFLFFMRMMRTECYDIIHAHTEEAHFYLSFVSYFCQLPSPIIMTEHYYRYKNIRFNPFRRMMYKRYRRVICVSDYMKEFFCSHLPAIRKNCVAIHNGINISRNRTSKPLDVIPHQPIKLICNARLVKQKDISTCIKAISHTSTDTQLVITGDGKLRKRLSKLIMKLNLQGKITLLGWRTDVTTLLQNADIYIQSSRWEGFSIAILEAMTAGLPLIVSNAAGLVEAVGDAALIFPIGNVKQLAAHIDELATNPRLRHELSQLSLARSQQFSLDIMWQKYANLYLEVIQEHHTHTKRMS